MHVTLHALHLDIVVATFIQQTTNTNTRQANLEKKKKRT